MQARPRSLTGGLLLLLCFVCLPAAFAQSKPQRHGKIPPSRVDLFGGFAYFHPYASQIGGYAYQPINAGAVTSLSAYFDRYFGLQAEGGFHPDGPNDCVYTAQGGPVLRLPKGRWIPFAHVLAGGAKIGGPVFQPCSWGWGLTSGLGVDYVLPRFNNRLALRLIQADWQYSHVDFGPLDATGVAGGSVDLKDYRLASGIVLRFGSIEPTLPLQISCSLHPESVFVGDPVMVSLQTANVDPKKTAAYSWTSTGGKVVGSGAAVTLDTTGLAAGSYTVSATVVEGKKAKQRAGCSESFTVRAYDPPAVTCVANPNSVRPGETSEITASGISPQNRSLTYSFTADAGQVGAVSGNSTILGTGGVPVGVVTVTCNAMDDLGKAVSATTTVTIVPPPPPPPPPTRPLCSQSFERDRKRPVRVDNEAKGCLDEIALELGREPDAKLVIVAHSDAADQPEAAEQRAVNVKRYLTTEKGIDPSRIELRTGPATGRTADAILVPAGATFSDDAAMLVDENSVQPEAPPKPKGPARH